MSDEKSQQALEVAAHISNAIRQMKKAAKAQRKLPEGEYESCHKQVSDMLRKLQDVAMMQYGDFRKEEQEEEDGEDDARTAIP